MRQRHAAVCHMSTGWRSETVQMDEVHAGKEQFEFVMDSDSACLDNGLMLLRPALTEMTTSWCAGPLCAGSSSENPGCLALQSGSHIEGLWVPQNTLADKPQQGCHQVMPQREVMAKTSRSRAPTPQPLLSTPERYSLSYCSITAWSFPADISHS